MLTLHSFYNLAPKKFKPKTMHIKTKAFTEKLPCSSHSRIHFQVKKHPPLKALCVKILVIPSQIYMQNNQTFDPSIIKLQAVVHIVNRIFFTNQNVTGPIEL